MNFELFDQQQIQNNNALREKENIDLIIIPSSLGIFNDLYSKIK